MNSLDKIVKNKKLPVLFIGSGIPKRYLKNFPSWDELLKESFNKVNSDPFYLGNYKEKFIREKLSKFEQYKKLGSIIENDFNDAFYKRKITFGRSKNPNWAKRGVSPYKMFIRDRLRKLQLIDDPQLKKELHELSLSKNKVAAFITTNYDNFIEDNILDKDYTVFTKQHELFSKNSYNISELYKIHGSIDDVNTIIITQEDYNSFNRDRKLFIAKMLTLFSESPIIFLGYSFTDENIRQIVIDFLSCLTEEQLKTISDNFIFITYKKGEQKLLETKKTIITSNGDTIPFTEIKTDNFLKIYQILNQLLPGMTPKNIRNTQRLVKQIVNNTITNNDPSNIIFGIDKIPEEILDKNIAIAIGYKEEMINQYGYTLVQDADILEDILFDNKNFNAKSMCIERFKSLPSNRLMPVYKYIKNSKIILSDVPKLEAYVSTHDDINKIITQSYKRKNLKNAELFSNINDIKNFFEKTKDISKTFKGVLNSMDNFSIDELKKICKFYFHDYIDILKKDSNFKRIVMYIDFEKNNKKIPTSTS